MATTTITSDKLANGTLPPDWRKVRFGDVVRNVDTYERSPLENGIERYVGLDHLDPESLHIKRWGNVVDGTTFTRKFIPGQVLFGKRRAYQRKAAVAEFEGICSGDILVFEPSNGELLPELLPFIVQSDGFFNHALGTSAGSLSPRTKWKDLADYEFALPPRDEQSRIAEILRAADEAVESLELSIGLLSDTNSIVFEELLKSNGVYLTSLEDDTKDLLYSKKWQRAESVCSLITKGTTPSADKLSSSEGEVPYIKVYNLTFNGKIDFETNPTYTTREAHEKELSRSRVFPGDVLMNIVGPPLGKVSLVPNMFSEWNVNQAIAIFRLNGHLNKQFLCSYLLNKKVLGWFLRRAKKTSGQMNLTLELCRELPVPRLSMEAQSRIVEILQKLDNAAIIQQDHLKQVRSLKQSIMQRFFTSS